MMLKLNTKNEKFKRTQRKVGNRTEVDVLYVGTFFVSGWF